MPEGCDIMFADGDMRNFDPENLVAVPHKLQAQLKACEYWDAESLEAAVAMCMLHTAIIDAKSAHKVCPICGKRFAKTKKTQKRCPECIAAKPRHSAERHRAIYRREQA